jgi:uncharacterized SAM-dependent methyltransferase
MPDAKASRFLKQLSAILNPKDKVVLGVDLIKPKHIVLPAYNDAQGITKQFNLNLLDRINKELGGNFNIEHFEHTPEYDENEGIARSYLTSSKKQSVTIDALKKTFNFKKDERIHMETSRKYNDAILKTLIPKGELEIINKLTDSNHYFADYILNKL